MTRTMAAEEDGIAALPRSSRLPAESHASVAEVSPRLWCYLCARELPGGAVMSHGELFCSIECAVRGGWMRVRGVAKSSRSWQRPPG